MAYPGMIKRKKLANWRWTAVFATVIGLFALSVAMAYAQSANQPAEGTLNQQLRQALALAGHGDQQQAMTLTLQLLRENPKFVPAIKLKAMLLEEAGQSADAGATYDEGLKLAPDDPDFLLKTGIYKLATGDRQQAIRLLEHCVRILPGDGDAHYYLAQAYHLDGQDERALNEVRASLKADPANPAVWQKYGELLCATGDCTSGLRWLQKAQHADSTLPRLDYDIAATDYKLLNFADAAQYAARAVEARPDDATALQLLATANLKQARWQEAKSSFDKLRSLNPTDVDALLGEGQCDLELKNYPTAIEELQTVLRLDPTRLQAHFYLSRAYAATDRAADAQHEAALHHLMMEQATFARTLENEQREGPIRAQAQQLLAANREADALQLYREHFKGTSATPADAYVFLGKLYLFMGKTNDGIRCLRESLKLQPTVRGAHTYEGIQALKENDLARAEKEFQAELDNDPSYQLAIAEMGEVRYHQQRWADAADQLAKSKTTTPELLYLLCDSYFHLGKTDDANLTAELAAAYGRNNPLLMKDLVELLTRNDQSDLAKRISANSEP
jgi:tetratricopeptide (TPR) repeat protein